VEVDDSKKQLLDKFVRVKKFKNINNDIVIHSSLNQPILKFDIKKKREGVLNKASEIFFNNFFVHFIVYQRFF